MAMHGQVLSERVTQLDMPTYSEIVKHAHFQCNLSRVLIANKTNVILRDTSNGILSAESTKYADSLVYGLNILSQSRLRQRLSD